MEVNELLSSKLYVKPQSGITFKSPSEYLQPFLDLIAPFTSDIRVSTGAEVTNANPDEQNSENTAFGRVVLEAKLPEKFTNLDHDTVIGIMYALDVQKPVLKAYTGQLARACTNLSIFNAAHIFEASLLGGYETVYEALQRYTNSVEPGIEDWMKKVKHLLSIEYTEKQVDEKLGYMLRKSLRANFTTGVISTAKSLHNPGSAYAIKEGKTSAWNVLSAATQYITDKTDIIAKPDVTLFAGGLFEPELKLMQN